MKCWKQLSDHIFISQTTESRIDNGHHESNAYRALHSTLELEDAVKTGVRMTNEEDTLIIVTADHSHGFSIAGYPDRGNDIFGKYDCYIHIHYDNSSPGQCSVVHVSDHAWYIKGKWMSYTLYLPLFQIVFVF